MTYKKINNVDILEFKKILEDNQVFTSQDILREFAQDQTEDLFFMPELVLKPKNTSEISAIMTYCNQHKIPVTPCGARTGLSGGSLPVKGGVVLSVEKLNKIIEIDQRNLQATVESGVINQVFKNAVKEKGLFYPPDPASQGSCMLGGNIAENAGGPKAMKYGVTKDYVLNLEVVLPSGDIIWTGANVLKNSTGYNLTQLMIGSEGTLGIVTKIVFKLISMPSQDITMLVSFDSDEKACESVSAVFRSGITPCALEFIEREAVEWTMKYTDLSLKMESSTKAYLLIEVDGNDLDLLYLECDRIANVMRKFNCGEILVADSNQEKENLWKIRRSIGEAVKSNSIYKEEDTVVPRAELPKLLKGVKKIGKKYGFKSVCYGHAGDGNLHINIIKGDMSDNNWNNNLSEAIREIFLLTKNLGGTISGEHGIGFVQKHYMDVVFSEKELSLQKEIKNIFDVNRILNPSKIFN